MKSSQRPQIALTPGRHRTTSSPGERQRETNAQAISKAGTRTYERQRDLPGLVPLWPEELLDKNPIAHRRLVMKLHRALRAERNRGLAAHWSYDLMRHTNLLHAYRHELHAAGLDWERDHDVMQVGSGRRRSSSRPQTTRPAATPLAMSVSYGREGLT